MSKSKLLDQIGQFTTIPNSIIELWPSIGVDGMALLVYLRYRTNGQTGDAFPSYDRITSDTLLTRRRIAQAIRQLESVGLIERKRRFSASTIYTLKMPDSISTDAELIKPSISTDARLPLVHPLHANHTEINQTEIGIPKSKTRDIQAAYESCVSFPVDWKKNEGHAAKWLSENGYTAEDVTACYKAMKADKFWADKPLTLSSVKNAIGEWKSNSAKRKVINVRC